MDRFQALLERSILWDRTRSTFWVKDIAHFFFFFKITPDNICIYSISLMSTNNGSSPNIQLLTHSFWFWWAQHLTSYKWSTGQQLYLSYHAPFPFACLISLSEDGPMRSHFVNNFPFALSSTLDVSKGKKNSRMLMEAHPQHDLSSLWGLLAKSVVWWGPLSILHAFTFQD